MIFFKNFYREEIKFSPFSMFVALCIEVVCLFYLEFNNSQMLFVLIEFLSKTLLIHYSIN
jgi:hypothetical protein